MRSTGYLKEKTVTLQEVTVKTKELSRREEAVAPSANFNGPGNADQVLTYDDFQHCNDLSSCLPGKVRGVIFKNVLIKGKIYTIPYGNTGMGNPMLVVLDGMPMGGDRSFSVMDIPAGNIQSIEVWRIPGRIWTAWHQWSNYRYH